MTFVLLPFLILPAEAQTAAPPPIKASFDCAKAKAKIDLLICSDAALAALDVREADMLRRARVKAVDPGGVNAEQDVWQQDRDRCSSVACLKGAYARRIQQLRAWVD
jgi:uncharacterized protein